MPVVMLLLSAPAFSSTPVHKVAAQNWYFCAAAPVVQVVPHGFVVLLQPLVASHASVVHSMPSSQDLDVPAVQTPARHVEAGA